MSNSKWIIAVPAYGAFHVDALSMYALHSYRLAAKYAGIAESDIQLVVYTEAERRVGAAARGFDIVFRKPPVAGDKYQQLGDVHRDALNQAALGSRVLMATADMIISCETFAACNERFASGSRAIVVGPSRTLPTQLPVPGMTSCDLLDWSMQNAHPFTLETIWGGHALPPSTLRFKSGKNVTMRGFHLHPIAILKEKEIQFQGTLDQTLLAKFSHHEIHVVTKRDEMAAAEVSPADLQYGLAKTPVGVSEVVNWAQRSCQPINWWLAEHRIVLCGEDNDADVPVWNQIIRNNALIRSIPRHLPARRR